MVKIILSKYNNTVDSLNFARVLRVKTRELTRGPYKPFKEHLKTGLAWTFEKFNVKGDSNDIQILIKNWGFMKLFPDVNEALMEMKKRFKLAVISNTDNDLIEKVLPSFKVKFDIVMTSEKAKAYKPMPSIYLATLSQVGASSEEAMHVARTQYDVFAAKGLGFKATWVNRDKEKLEKRESAPDYIVNDLQELLRLL